jgi:cytosine/adenosine deaminase-related metal-dependent hydrolase
VQFDCCPLNNFFWLTKAYVELAIIIVLAYGGGPARPWDLAGCLDMIARAAARLMRLKDYGVAGGGPADLVCLDANSPADAVATLAQPLWGIKRGRLSFTRSRPQLHPPDSD